MPLPVLRSRHAVTSADLLRLFVRTEQAWAEHLGEPARLDGGTAVASRALADVAEANAVFDAALPPGESADSLIAAVDAHFAEAGAACRRWWPNVSAAPERIAPLAEALQARGFAAESLDVLRLEGTLPEPTSPPEGMRVLPARSAFGMAKALAAESAAERGLSPAHADADLLHLDDPQCDALLAIENGRAVGRVTVLAAGEIGRIAQLHVAPPHRRRGVGRLLLERAIEICARSLFKHVLIGVEAEDEGKRRLLGRVGFTPVGRSIRYAKPIHSGV